MLRVNHVFCSTFTTTGRATLPATNGYIYEDWMRGMLRRYNVLGPDGWTLAISAQTSVLPQDQAIQVPAGFPGGAPGLPLQQAQGPNQVAVALASPGRVTSVMFRCEDTS